MKLRQWWLWKKAVVLGNGFRILSTATCWPGASSVVDG